MSSPGIFQTRVVRHRSLCRAHFELALAVDSFPAAAPGQFVQILCRDPEELGVAPGAAMLRRPFSLAGLRITSKGCEIDIIGRVVGPGTAWLAGRASGDPVNILG